MKLSCAPLSKRQVTSSSSTSTFPKFLGPMSLWNASGFKYGALFILRDLFGHASACQQGFCFCPLWSQLVLGRPLWLQGPLPVFFLILPMVPLEVAQLATGEAPLGLHLLGLHSMGHFHLEDRVIGYGLLQITGDVQPFIVFLG